MAASGALHEPRRLGVLDGLRGIAVLLVLWYHIWEISWLQPVSWLVFVPATGFLGVTLFFFLSGFVITHNYYVLDGFVVTGGVNGIQLGPQSPQARLVAAHDQRAERRGRTHRHQQ